jgi:hypothetical protein
MMRDCSFADASAEEARVLQIGRLRVGCFLEAWARQQWPHPQPAPTAPSRMGILDLLASCYLQGVTDAAESITRKGWTPPAEECR